MYDEIKEIVKNLRRKSKIPYFFENKNIFISEDNINEILIVNIVSKNKENCNSCKITIDCKNVTVDSSITIIESNIYHIEIYIDYIRDIISFLEKEIFCFTKKRLLIMSKDNLCIDKNERMWKNEIGKSFKTSKGK